LVINLRVKKKERKSEKGGRAHPLSRRKERKSRRLLPTSYGGREEGEGDGCRGERRGKEKLFLGKESTASFGRKRVICKREGETLLFTLQRRGKKSFPFY